VLPAAALTATLALTGCSADEPGASASTSPSASAAASDGASSSAEPSQAPPDGSDLPGPSMPEDARTQNDVGAESYISYYIAVLNYATTSGDTERLRTLGTDDCDSCDALASAIEDIYDAGGRVETRGWALDNIVPQADTPPDRPQYQLVLKIAPQTVLPKADAKPKDYPGGTQQAHVILSWTDQGWRTERFSI
jgi:hypothetical protein